jgi:hypothetical protein
MVYSFLVLALFGVAVVYLTFLRQWEFHYIGTVYAGIYSNLLAEKGKFADKMSALIQFLNSDVCL